MSTTVNSIVADVKTILQDDEDTEDLRRWKDVEIVRWLNAGQAESVIHKPNIYTEMSSMLLTAGSRQAIAGIQLLDVTRNMGTTVGAESDAGDMITLIDRAVIDRMIPDWHYQRAGTKVKYVVFDERNPKVFWVYPKSLGTNYIETVQAVVPPVVAAGGNISLGDEWVNALTDYILYRCYLKDSDHSPHAVKAFSYYQAFLTALGSKAKLEIVVSPNEKDK